MQTESLYRPAARSAPLRQTLIVAGVLLAVTVLVRLPGVTRPLLGNYATRMTIHGMIARNWALGNAPAWKPTVDCLRDGKPGLHLVEVPLSAYLSGITWRVFGGSLDVWGRLMAIAFSGAAVTLMYFLARRWHGVHVALVAAVVLALSPVSIIYGQGFMLEPSIVCLTLGVLLAFDVWLERRDVRWWSAWVVLFAALLLTKVYMLVLLLPLGTATWGAFSSAPRWRSWVPAVLGIFLAASPALAWCAFVLAISQPGSARFAEVHYSLAHSADANGWPHPLLADAAFYGRAFANLATLVLTPLPLLFAIIACFRPEWRRHLPWLVSMAALFFLLPRKFDELNYYYLVVLPPLAMLVGLGFERCIERWEPRRVWIGLAVCVTLACSLRYTLRPAFVTPTEDRAVVSAANEVQRLASRDEPVVTMHGSAIDLLYYCDRRGWAIPPERKDLVDSLEECHRQGARLLVVADIERAKRDPDCGQILDSLELLSGGEDYRIYRLDATVAARPSTGDASAAATTSSKVELVERRARSSTPQAPGTR